MKSLAALLLVVAVATPAVSAAQQVSTRAQLQGLLTSSVTEGFEAFPIADGAFIYPVSNPLDNTTGPVAAGIRFSAGRMQMNGPNYFGMPSNTLLGALSPFTISFLNFTQGFGLDATNFAGFAFAYSALVYGPANTFLGAMSFSGSNAPASEFVGWYSAGGIDRVEFSLGSGSWSTSVDDVEFGTAAVTATPEPASVVLLGTGLLGLFGIARRKRSK